MEDLNNILNSGDVPNIYSLDELDQIYSALKVNTKTIIFNALSKLIKINLIANRTRSWLTSDKDQFVFFIHKKSSKQFAFSYLYEVCIF